ncbi:serine/threonine-protein kinase [Streptomyces sp. NPDC021080]|uniref:serine/threonine-protein kinase n=1 Tax=Streptomyces sp. NPDC021080 TaxID=3365110 RepID=UPI0037AA325A
MKSAAETFQPLEAEDPRLVAGYRIAARLGAGGMGRVYLSHTRGGRPVAIKVVRPELADSPDFRHRFRREIQAAQRVRGAYTAELIDADADGTPPWLATLYVPGPSLSEVVARRGPLPVQAVLWLMAGVAEALEAIHGAGIVHRDLKPSNVLLAADGPRVIDFGISLASGITWHTATGAAIGTPQFMAPEQASASEVTAATDVFALGQTAAFAALGEPLYGDGPSVGVLYRIVHSEPDLSPLPEQIRPVIARCLAADPTERATPAEIVHMCRQRLGRDADDGAGPAVWRDITGPEMTVPAPVPDPTPVHAMPLIVWPQAALPVRPSSPRRRAARFAAFGVAITLLFAGLVYTIVEGAEQFRRIDALATSTSTHGASPRTSAPAKGSGTVSGADRRTPGPSDAPATASATPLPEAHPLQWLDDKHSLYIEQPVDRDDAKGDIRFVCDASSCALTSDTSVITMLYTEKPGATLDSCRIALGGATSHRLPLAAAAAGSEICVKHPSGDIALLVIQVKSTALADKGSFLTADMTVWRASA